MKRCLILMALVLALLSPAWGKDIDTDSNDAVDIEFGGTNSNTAAAARTALGLEIGSDVAAFGHTHTGVYEPADATILKDANIGVTVQGYSANLDAVTTPGSAGTFLKSDGTNVSWDVAGGSGGGTISGTLGSTDNVVLRSDGTGGVTAQGSLVTISDGGTVNIPTGQTYNIAGVAHTHNYQPLDSDLTLWGAITPSANVQSLAGAADYSAMRTLLSLRPGTDIQAYDADLSAIAGITRAQGSLIIGGAAAWEGLAVGTVGKVLKSTGTTVAWADDNNDGGAGVSTWDELGDSAADATIALGGYKTIFTSTLDTGAIWTMTDTDASLSAATSFFDMKATSDGDANLYFMRGYDNSGNDLKWSIGQHGAFYGYSFETAQSATGGKIDLLEGSGNGTDYMTLKADDDVGTNRKIALSSSVADSEDLTIQLGANDNKVTLGSTTGVDTLSISAMNLVTTGSVQGGIKINSDANGMSAAEMTAVGMYGTLFIATGAGTWILPTAAEGMSACLMSSGAAADLILDTTAGDTLRLKGTEGGDGKGATNAAAKAAGDFICVVATAANKWSSMGMSGAWVIQP